LNTKKYKIKNYLKKSADTWGGKIEADANMKSKTEKPTGLI